MQYDRSGMQSMIINKPTQKLVTIVKDSGFFVFFNNTKGV